MAPAVVIDNTIDFDTPLTNRTAMRTLLLAPPSVSAHPEALTQVAEAYDRDATDIQMLDRLAMGLAALPSETYDLVLLLTDVDGSRQQSAQLLSREVMERIVASMKAGSRLRSQDGSFGSTGGAEQTEAILAGLLKGERDGMVKPNSSAGQTVQLRLGKKKANAAAVPANSIEAEITAKRKSEDISTGGGTLAQASGNGSLMKATPAGVGFIDSLDDFDGGYDDGSGYESDDMEIPSNEELLRAEKIDPDTLLTEEDRKKPLVIRKSCRSLCHRPLLV